MGPIFTGSDWSGHFTWSYTSLARARKSVPASGKGENLNLCVLRARALQTHRKFAVRQALAVNHAAGPFELAFL